MAGVLRACDEAGAAVVPQGGNTGLVGGGVPRGGEVVLSLARLEDLEAVDGASGQVVAGAGVTLEGLQRHARASGFDFTINFGARSAATVGGMVATNAGGTRVLRYGAMREHVLGLEAALADGRVIERLSGLVKDTAGYAVPSLLVGSEGTLAVVTRARLRLARHLPARVAALLAVAGTAEAVALLAHLRGRLPSLEAAEVFFADGLDLVCDALALPPPFQEPHPAYLLVECADVRDPVGDLAAALEDAPGLRAEVAADDAAGRAALWAYREGHSEAIGRLGVPHKLDVAVPLVRLGEFERRVRDRVAEVAPAARVLLFGHLAEGNLHVNVVGPEPEAAEVDGAVLGVVAECGGSVSAEHGVGIAKRGWLPLTRSAADIDAMAAIKRALDPRGTLNPGVVLDPVQSAGAVATTPRPG